MSSPARHPWADFPTMADPVIAEEPLATFTLDAQALLTQHYREIAEHQDIPLAIDWPTYANVEAAGLLCLVTARIGGHLVGYCVFTVSPHPHYATSLQAQEDVIYLHPALRGRGLGTTLLLATERILRARGVQLVHHHVKVKHPALGTLLEGHGYAIVEHIYSKRLDRTGD